ncbi:MAG TPA: VOC family protein [Pseudolysinimonas sp.]|jgi:PhnB protein
MSGATPYFQFPGTAREALTRYQEIFGGELKTWDYAEFGRTDGPADAIAHGTLDGPISVFGSDAAEGEASFTSTGFFLSVLGGGDAATSQRWFDALGEGGTVVDPLQERPWGDWDGQVRDRFGVTWLIGYAPS